MNVIQDIFYGTLDMQDAVCDDPQYSSVLRELITADSKLRESLTGEQKKLLDSAKKCNNRLNDVTTVGIFAEGFRLGAVLMLEILFPEMDE